MQFPKSKAGWSLVAIYLAVSSVLIYQAFTCTGWVCDLVEFPATIPFGVLYLLVLRWLNPVFVFGNIVSEPFRNWYFIIPTLAGNSVVFYWLGVGMGKLTRKIFRRAAV